MFISCLNGGKKNRFKQTFSICIRIVSFYNTAADFYKTLCVVTYVTHIGVKRF